MGRRRKGEHHQDHRRRCKLDRPVAGGEVSVLRMYLAGAWTAALMCCLAGTGGCRNRNESEPTLSPADSVRILRGVLAHRAEADSFFLHDPESPFVNDTSIRFHGIRWYPPDPGFVFHSLLTRAEPPETVTIAGTRGDLRREIRAGYFILSRGGRE